MTTMTTSPAGAAVAAAAPGADGPGGLRGLWRDLVAPAIPGLDPRTRLTRDVLASIVVVLVAMPLCMGIAIASGVPPAKGLITGIVGGIVVGLVAGAPLQVSGPAAGLAVLVFEFGREHGFAALGPVLLLAGLIQLAAGIGRLGQWFRAISPAVIHGMLAGIGVLIVAAQVHVMLDAKPEAGGLDNLLAAPGALLAAVGGGDGLAALAIGLVTVAAMLAWDRLRPARLRYLPGALIGVVAATVAAMALGLQVRRVEIPASLTEAIDLVTLPDLAILGQTSLLVSALAIAVIASAETLLSAAAVDRMHDGARTRYDRELVAQGLGNTICGFLGALPMTGVIVRSSANVQAGAASRLSTILHGIWILLIVLALAGLLRQVPMASLAGVLVLTGVKLVNPDQVRALRTQGRAHLAIYGITLAAIVATDLLTGVIVGLGLSLAHLIAAVVRLRLRLRVDEGRREADLELAGTATFLQLPRLARVLARIPPGTTLRLETRRLRYIDPACLELLSEWERSNRTHGSELAVRWDALQRRRLAAAL